ncbi:hypothetical protein CSB69_0270 [Morganella morganii]|nr:hypothetical protein CSB69_0270 [Morganella morganii]
MIFPFSTFRLILQPEAQYGQTVMTFSINIAPISSLSG